MGAPHEPGYNEFYRSSFDVNYTAPSGSILWSSMKTKNYNSQLGVSGNYMSDYRCLFGKPSGTISMADSRNCMMFKGWQTEHGDYERTMEWFCANGARVAYSTSHKISSESWNCLEMSQGLANTLMSLGFTTIQDMGADGQLYGATRRIDSANIKNGDWQWWNFAMRWGVQWIRVYK